MRRLLPFLLVFCLVSFANADSTRQMPNHPDLLTVTASDTVWVYDSTTSTLHKMTVENLIGSYLGGVLPGNINQVLINDGLGGIDWVTLTATLTGASGTTRFHGDTGVAEPSHDGSGTAIWLSGTGGVTVTSSGSTVVFTASGVTEGLAFHEDLSAYTDASAFTGVTDFAVNSQVTAFVVGLATDYTDAAAFTGATGFSLPTDTHTGPIESTEIVRGGASKYYIYSGATLTGDMLTGGMLFCHGASTITLGVPSFSGSTGYFGVWDMTGSGVTIQTTDGDTLYNDTETGTALFVNAGNSRHSAALTLNAESGTCSYVLTLSVNGINWITK